MSYRNQRRSGKPTSEGVLGGGGLLLLLVIGLLLDLLSVSEKGATVLIDIAYPLLLEGRDELVVQAVVGVAEWLSLLDLLVVEARLLGWGDESGDTVGNLADLAVRFLGAPDALDRCRSLGHRRQPC